MTDETVENGTVSASEVPESVRANLDAISDDISGDSPTPNLAAIGAEADKTAQAKLAHAHLRDVDGNPFDPELHVTDADGTPKTTKGGKLRKRPGRKAGSVGKPSAGGLNIQSAEHGNAVARQQARMGGAAAANSLIMLGVVLGGDEWQPQKDDQTGLDEREVLQQAFGDYFEAKNMQDIPPGVALSIAICAYAAPRFTMPQTKTRMQRFKEWAAAKIAKRRIRRATQSHTRNDRERKDDASESSST